MTSGSRRSRLKPMPYTDSLSRIDRLRSAATTRPWLAQVGMGLGLFLVLGLLIQAEQGGFRVPGIFAYVCALALSCLLLLSRRYPLGVLLASVGVLTIYYLLGYPDIGLGIPLAPALYLAAARRRLKWPLAIVGALLFLIVAASVFAPSYENQLTLMIYSYVPDAALMAAVIALGDDARSQSAVRARTQRLIEVIGEQERAQAQAAAATERTKVAQELHDSLGHQTALVLLHADVAGEALPQDTEVAQKSVAVVRDTSRRMMYDLRDTVRTLREQDMMISTPRIEELRPLIFDQLPIEVEETIDIPEELPELVSHAAYRIVQESLSNVVKHSRARRVSVRISSADDLLEVIVYDDGPRRPESSFAASGFGIIGMKERARTLGGRVTTESSHGGFRVRALLPVRVASEVGAPA